MKTIRAACLLPFLYIAVGTNVALAITSPSELEATQTGIERVTWEWGAVDDAIEYQVTVDGAFAGTTDSTLWVSEDLWVGTHSMTVKAIDQEGEVSEQSETLKIEVEHRDEQAVSDGESDGESRPMLPASDVDDTGFVDPDSYRYPEVIEKSDYELVFSDEFNADSLNSVRWHSQLRWDGDWNGERYEYRVINGESQFYVNVLSPDEEHQEKILPYANPFEFDGSRLAIRAKVNPFKTRDGNKSYGPMMDIAEQQDFISGAISTHEKFSRKYGYFEARIRIPSHVGTFPAFWLFHKPRSWEGTQRTEIDIMENLGHAPHYIYNSFHYFKNVTEYYSGDANFVKPKPSGQIYTGIDYSADYHVYAVEWEPGKISWFIDGEKVSELENAEVDYEELYLMINLAIGGNWTNYPSSAGGLGRPGDQRFPTSRDIEDFQNPALEIDYVRVFERR